MGRIASRAFAWNKGGAVARPARTLLRALLAMILAAATLLAMLVVPPANMAFADEGARWDYGGTGYVSGKGFAFADSTRDLSISYPRLWTKDGKKKITWTILFNKDAMLLKYIRGGYVQKDKKTIQIQPHSPFNGRGNAPARSVGFSGGRPLFMAFLPKGISNVEIRRRRTGHCFGMRKDACWPYETDKKWYKDFREDVLEDKWVNSESDVDKFLSESWADTFKRLGMNGVSLRCNGCKNHVNKGDIEIGSFTGSDNRYHYNGTDSLFDTAWNEALGEKRLGSGNYTGESPNNYSLNEIRQWKSKFQVVLESWENEDYTKAVEWKVTGDYDDSIKNPELLPLIAGWNSSKGGTIDNGDYGSPFPGTRDEWQSKWSFVGPYDTDGDGIPDLSEFYLGTDPTKKTNILYPVYKSKMLSDYPKRSTKNPTDYGGTDNVPVTTYKEPITVKPFVNVGTWVSTTFDPNLFKPDKNADGSNATSTDLHHAIDLPGAENTAYLNMSYAITGVPDNGVTNNNWQGCDTNTKDGCVKIDSKTGYITYRPRKDDWKKYPDGLEFKVKVTHINPNIYPYNSDKNKGQAWVEENVPVKIKVLSNASLYNPQYETTNVKYDANQNKFNPATSEKPKSVKNTKKPWVREGDLPNGTKFEPKQYTMKIGNNTNPRGDAVLPWSSISKKSPDNTGNGKVTFKPNKSNAGESTHTPVLATYPDGSTSEDTDAGNESVVYAPVKVEELPVNGGDLHLALKKGTQINNNQFSGWDFSKDKPYELTKGTKIGAPTKEDSNPGNGIVLDSWSTNAKGPITFRAVCHKKNDSKYELLKPAEGKNKASGEINGLKFEEFRQWIRDNDKSCKVKGANCSDDNHYLHPGEYNKDTMERSRALIGGKPKKAGEYECKVFAFHQAHGGKGTQYNEALTKFDTLAKDNGAGFAFAFDVGSTFADSKGKQWVSDKFYFKIKLNDNQKYNPTYMKTPEFEAGSVPNGAISKISTDQPKSMKKITVGNKTENANGVSDADLESVVDNNTPLPNGTWFTIKRLIKKVDNKKPNDFPVEGEIWSQFEGDESNKVDGKDEAKDKDPNSKREYGAVTFRPTKWQDAGEYWAEVVAHYPDGSTSDGEGSINKDHPIYAKVKVTRPKTHNPDIKMQLRSQYNSSDGSVSGAWIGTSNDLAGIDRATGVTVMRGIGLMHDMGIDSWAETEVGPIYQKMLCTEKDKNYWHENLPGLNFQLGANRKEWKHSSFKQNEDCRKKGNCDSRTSDYLYNDYVDRFSGNTMERTRASITNKTAPAKTGEYYCAVFTMKKSLEKAYVSNLGRDGHSANGVNLKLVNAVNGKDVTVQFFPVHVVEPFNLPKTGGEDCVNWNMLMSVVCVLGTGAMAAGFFLDQTKWGRAVWRAVAARVGLRGAAAGACGSAGGSTARAACAAERGAARAAVSNRAVGAAAFDHAEPALAIKSFIRKTAEWCGGLMLRIEWWITERWRC